MATHSVAITWSGAGAPSIGGSIAKTATEQLFVDETLAIGTNVAVNCDFNTAGLKMVFMLADKNCTLKFNSSGSPVPLVTLAAGVPQYWIEGQTALFTADVTQVFVTNAAITRLQINVLSDPTP